MAWVDDRRLLDLLPPNQWSPLKLPGEDNAAFLLRISQQAQLRLRKRQADFERLDQMSVEEKQRDDELLEEENQRKLQISQTAQQRIEDEEFPFMTRPAPYNFEMLPLLTDMQLHELSLELACARYQCIRHEEAIGNNIEKTFEAEFKQGVDGRQLRNSLLFEMDAIAQRGQDLLVFSTAFKQEYFDKRQLTPLFPFLF